MSLTIWLPESARPAFRCNVCDRAFGSKEREAWTRHVVKCADVNEEVIAQEYEDAQKVVFSGMDEDTRGEYLETRQKALSEGVIGKGLHTPKSAAKGKVR
ncbi:MAG: hypothetical protein HUU17_06235 [Chthonomonadales bacterium]|nr:hypothetical protein [Chthonomonadales bacterium]